MILGNSCHSVRCSDRHQRDKKMLKSYVQKGWICRRVVVSRVGDGADRHTGVDGSRTNSCPGTT